MANQHIQFLAEVKDIVTGEIASVFGQFDGQEGYLATSLKGSGKYMTYCTRHERLFSNIETCKECEVKQNGANN